MVEGEGKDVPMRKMFFDELKQRARACKDQSAAATLLIIIRTHSKHVNPFSLTQKSYSVSLPALAVTVVTGSSVQRTEVVSPSGWRKTSRAALAVPKSRSRVVKR